VQCNCEYKLGSSKRKNPPTRTLDVEWEDADESDDADGANHVKDEDGRHDFEFSQPW
jgi:hypothetical protein